MKTCLVTGATGAVGPRVVRALSETGYRVRALSLDAPVPGLFPEGVEVRLGDVTDAATVESATVGVDTIFHLAALLHIVNPPPALREKYERVNVGGTGTVIENAVRANTRRVVFFSTIAVYGGSSGQALTEESPPRPDSFYAQTKLAAENLVLDAKRRDGQPIGSVLRLGSVYGPRIKGNYRWLLKMLAAGRFLPLGSGCNRRTLVYDRDVARAALLAAEHPAAAGRIFNITDGQLHTMNEIISTICAALGHRPPRLRLPVAPVRLAVGFLEDAMSLLGRQSSIGRAMIEKYTEDAAVAGQRVQAELGFVPRFDLMTGWRETIDEMRQSGEL